MKLGIGTAQFGLEYGISNQEGKTSLSEVKKIIEVAALNQARIIDTAPAYGESEEVLGKTLPPQHSFDIVTKTPKFSKDSITKKDAQLLEDTFYQSLGRLNQSSIYGLLVHHADDLLAKDGYLLLEKMIELKQEGLVKKIGVSIYTGGQIDRILDKYSIDFIQIPINVLDQRLLFSGHLHKMKKLKIEIHARSIFLQGLLLMPPDHLPSYFDSIRAHLKNYYEFILQQKISPLQAAISFVTGLSEIDVVIVGINNCQHLQEILLEAFKNKSGGLVSQDLVYFALKDSSILNPSKWRI
jgi:aryl-alcohol dehydrogenase-like predicted oxidoreductase